jgi:hypothetical protein
MSDTSLGMSEGGSGDDSRLLEAGRERESRESARNHGDDENED